MTQTFFDWNLWYPLFIHKTFRKQNFFKNSTIHLRSSSALWDKNFSTEFRDIPFLCIKFCDTRIFLKHRIVPQQNFSVLCDKIFRGRNVIPPTTHKIFRYQSFSGKQKCSFTKLFFPVLWHKKFWQNRDAPPLLCMKVFEIKNFLKHKIVLQWNILAMWDKNF